MNYGLLFTEVHNASTLLSSRHWIVYVINRLIGAFFYDTRGSFNEM